jgi:hypothetical protein
MAFPHIARIPLHLGEKGDLKEQKDHLISVIAKWSLPNIERWKELNCRIKNCTQKIQKNRDSHTHHLSIINKPITTTSLQQLIISLLPINPRETDNSYRQWPRNTTTTCVPILYSLPTVRSIEPTVPFIPIKLDLGLSHGQLLSMTSVMKPNICLDNRVKIITLDIITALADIKIQSYCSIFRGCLLNKTPLIEPIRTCPLEVKTLSTRRVNLWPTKSKNSISCILSTMQTNIKFAITMTLDISPNDKRNF